MSGATSVNCIRRDGSCSTGMVYRASRSLAGSVAAIPLDSTFASRGWATESSRNGDQEKIAIEHRCHVHHLMMLFAFSNSMTLSAQASTLCFDPSRVKSGSTGSS